MFDVRRSTFRSENPMIISVLHPGFLTTVQDLGRPGWAHQGVSASGAADALSLRLGNRLCGNPEGAAALELTLVGGRFEFDDAGVICLAGADFGPALDGRPVPLWTALPVQPGQVLQTGPTRGGARCYLCVRGGLEVPAVLGSASTHLLTGLGGLAGRLLRKGDALAVRPHPQPPPGRLQRLRPAAQDRLRTAGPLRVVAGPQADHFSAAVRQEFHRAVYRVTETSDRMGLRLAGPALEKNHAADLVTEGAPLGAVQVPRDGQPIILFVEHQTTGGYPKIANVISADFHRLGQLRPRDEVRFEAVSMAAALERLREQEDLLKPEWMVNA
jgi:antagonist of KipI